MLSIFPRDVLDEIWDLIESVSEGFPTYPYIQSNSKCNNRCKLDTKNDVLWSPHRNIHCMYSLESLCIGNSDEYPQCMIFMAIKVVKRNKSHYYLQTYILTV